MKARNDNRSRKSWSGRVAQNIFRGLLLALVAVAVSGMASAQSKTEEIASFNLFPNPTTPAAITPPAGTYLIKTTFIQRLNSSETTVANCTVLPVRRAERPSTARTAP